LQAAVLSVKLRYLDEWNSRRSVIASQYLQGLTSGDIVFPHVPEWANPVWHLFVVRHVQRDLFQHRLTEAGIGVLIHYPIPPHKQRAYRDEGYASDAYPLASSLANEVLSLPIGPAMAMSDVQKVIEICNGLALTKA
jgi:dTDP-4-amino-4,6-dideoxygalactose transaminase